ncbi:MAG: hypothetical protein Q8K63_05315 [Acidimicrobiales bacterium]|nr:hypothetical protein [Acidimicrobiales bacterium]
MSATDPTAGPRAAGGYVLENGQVDTYADNDTVPLASALDAVAYLVDHTLLDPQLRWVPW